MRICFVPFHSMNDFFPFFTVVANVKDFYAETLQRQLSFVFSRDLEAELRRRDR